MRSALLAIHAVLWLNTKISRMARKASSKPADSTANLGFEAKLWLAADKLRNNMDAAEPSGARQTVHSTARRGSAANQYKHAFIHESSIYGQDKCARRQRPFGLAKRARRVRLRGQQPKQSNATTRRLAIMNLAIRGIEADFGPEHADTFRRDLHPDLRADYVLANPPFNDSDWFRKDDDVRWQFGVPPKGNANFAWVQHFIHHLAPQGMAGFVLANGSMSSNQSGEGEIQRALIEADLVDCMVALPGQLFYSTQIPVCLWFSGKNNTHDSTNDARLFDGETELRLVA